jgi:hypothetical protein
LALPDEDAGRSADHAQEVPYVGRLHSALPVVAGAAAAALEPCTQGAVQSAA